MKTDANCPEGDPAFSAGRADVTTIFVLAAPGEREGRAGRPAAGQTGRNLEGILAHLHRADPTRFPSSRLGDYPIVNAFAGVLYDGKDGRSMPRRDEVVGLANLSRLAAALTGMRTIVALSDVAIHAVREAGRAPDFVGPHSSLRGLNNAYRVVGGDSASRAAERQRRFADDLLRTEQVREAPGLA